MSAGAADHAAVRPEPPTTYYEGSVELPGYGEARDRCRDYTPVGACEHGHTILGRSSCETRDCPDHWRDWIEEAVISMVARLAAYREAREGAEKRLSHVVASPPQDRRYSTRALWGTRGEAYDAMTAAGIDGGAAVTHAYRTNDRGDALYAEARDAGDLDEDRGKWSFLREVTDGMNDLSRYIEPAPHYHALAAGEDIRGDHAPDGWVVENIRSLGRFHRHDSEAYREMVAPAYYVLTHAAVQEGRQGTTYFGSVHPSNFDPEEELAKTAWDRIQREAEEAVRLRPSESESELGAGGPEECPHDECEADVFDLSLLPERIEDPDFRRRVEREGGRKRWLRLRGVFVWWDGRTDRPPPSVATSEARLREWLEQRGRTLTVEPSQVSLGKVLS